MGVEEQMKPSAERFPGKRGADWLRTAKSALGRALRSMKGKETRLVQGMLTTSVEKRPADEDVIVERLMRSYAESKKQQSNLADPYAPGAEWKVLHEKEWVAFRKAIAAGDREQVASFLRNFFRNEALTGFWGGYEMFAKFAASTAFEHEIRTQLLENQLAIWREHFPDTPLAELRAPEIGNPWGYFVDGALIYEPACEYHLQAELLAASLSHLDRPVVLEIGGGFGGLAYFLRRRMPNLKYIGFDLPESALLQAYYLCCAYPQTKVMTFREGMAAISAEHIAEHDVIILPNFMLPHIESQQADLIINVRSFSEMPRETIVEYVEQVDRIGRLLVFHENIYKNRLDGWHGIPTTEFPPFQNFVEAYSAESRWPNYNRSSGYPCREHLFIHKDALRTPGREIR